MNKAQKGFTLIELMIVIAIIGILAAIAIPQYQDYVTRSKVTEGLNLAAAAKTAVAETFQAKGSMPTTGTNASFGLPTGSSIAGTYVSSVSVAAGTAQGTGGVITITYGPADANLSTKVLTLVPITTAGGISWECGYSTITVDGITQAPTGNTTVLPKYLPQNCRA
jgi:type IV pilus assembly protein PilA